MGKRWAERLVIAVLLALFAMLPVLIVLTVSGPASSSFVVKVEVEKQLATTQEGKLEFLLVRGVAGRGPADRFVITLDRGYTAGTPAATRPTDVFAVEGTLMDRETYFGEQYLFFGYPQLYVSQVKTGLLWPSQARDLSALYASPVSSVTSLYAAVALPFMEEFTARSWLLMVARAFSVIGVVALALRWRRRPARVVEVMSAYLSLAVLLAFPGLAG